jgi:hypothetical protein
VLETPNPDRRAPVVNIPRMKENLRTGTRDHDEPPSEAWRRCPRLDLPERSVPQRRSRRR